MLVLSINHFFSKSYLRVATGWSGKGQGKPGKVREFTIEKCYLNFFFFQNTGNIYKNLNLEILEYYGIFLKCNIYEYYTNFFLKSCKNFFQKFQLFSKWWRNFHWTFAALLDSCKVHLWFFEPTNYEVWLSLRESLDPRPEMYTKNEYYGGASIQSGRMSRFFATCA